MGAGVEKGFSNLGVQTGHFQLEKLLLPGPHGALDGHWPSPVGVPGSWLGEPGVGAAGGPVPGSA